jgi:CDP-diacylglycerol--glycerol-3-phosphate 3-phosphatidyltransferase
MGIIGRVVSKTGLTPNMITVIGLFLNLAVAAVIASGSLVIGGLLVLLAGAFDVVDGAVARETGQVSKFGGFFDSTIDRYADAIVLGGILIYILREDLGIGLALLVYIVAVGSFLISYTRAKAELLGLYGAVGFAQRAERVIILSIMLMINQLAAGLILLAILTNLTVLQRGYHVWRSLGSEETDN